MWRFVSYRLLQAIPVILAVITVTFFLVRVAPGGPFDSEKAVMPEVTVESFSTMDLNADGALDAAEVEAAQEAGLIPA